MNLYPSDCIMINGSCYNHVPCTMLQIFSLKLAKLPVDGGFVELYGYVAVRDDLDPLLHYVVNISRDDPITLEEGSLIKMVGPKRGIYMQFTTLLEYDLRIKTGEQEKDDLSLIDGASLIGPAGVLNEPFKFPISSGRGAIGITLSSIPYAVEATIEVLISEVQSRFSLSLGCLTSELDEKIRLFDGAIAESCFLKRYLVAVMKNSFIDLKFKVGTVPSSFDQHCCSFMAKIHGHDTQEIKTDFALIIVKLTWSTLRSLKPTLRILKPRT
ncbi:hypothetical protein PR202_gb15491 [Eleusine coracana subsp. coracana]|uniref:DUF6598 domain-containing protein n=1 Tax=Eleusine coracana subsp. coracana TaxID=191504 RepID=A0AAV5EVM1_ELECO|nr:hypothetical protein PR202_gb15491 [Eleusine coracana subsp. coracana]